MPQRSTSRRLVTLDDAAQHLSCCTRTIRRYIAAGTINAYRLGPRMLRVDLAELEAALRPVPTAASA